MELWDIQGGPRRLLGCGLESPTNPLEFNDGRPCKWWWSPGGLTQVRRGCACDPHQAKSPTGWGRVCVCVCGGVDISLCVCVHLCLELNGQSLVECRLSDLSRENTSKLSFSVSQSRKSKSQLFQFG